MTKLQKGLLIGVPALIGGYLLYRQFRGTKTYQQAALDTPPGTPNQGGNQGGDPGTDVPNPTMNFKQYKVTTLATPLNVRQEPSTSSAKIGSLPKGTIIYARASQTSGWMVYSADGTSEDGFVSASYLTAI